MVTGVAVAALVSAGPAEARRTCQDAGTATVCETNGSVLIATQPGTTAPPANRPQLPWYVWD